jgi:hypothetical protein
MPARLHEAAPFLLSSPSNQCPRRRITYFARIVSSGASAKVAQHLGRHSTVQITLGRYAHVSLQDVAAPVDSLAGPGPGGPAGGALAPTGTDGSTETAPKNLAQTLARKVKKRGQSGTSRDRNHPG